MRIFAILAGVVLGLAGTACGKGKAVGQLFGGSITGFTEEFVGPLGGWQNVTAFPCSADNTGATNAASAIETCFNNMSPSKPVIWFPAGTYKIQDISATVTSASGTSLNVSSGAGIVNNMYVSCPNVPVGDWVVSGGGTTTLALGTAITGTVSGTCHFGLDLRSKHYVSLIGADPNTTIWSWAGTSGGTMLIVDGVDFSRIDRFTFEGNNAAGVIVDQSGYTSLYISQTIADVGNEYADDHFQNAAIGYRCGAQSTNQCSESVMLRDNFTKLTSAGISTGNYNADDVWVWWSQFSDNAIGVTNNLASPNGGAGNFSVYGSKFLRSTQCDVSWGNLAGAYNFVNNYSSGASQFVCNVFPQQFEPVVVRGNTVVNTASAVSVQVNSFGPLLFIGNTIVTSPSATSVSLNGYTATAAGGPYAVAGDAGSSLGEMFSYGNTFTLGSVSSPCTLGSTAIYSKGRCHGFSDTINASASPAAPTLPIVPPNEGRPVYEVSPSGSGTTCSAASPCSLQTGICLAATGSAAFSGNCSATVAPSRNVVHLIAGSYSAAAVVPSNADIQIIGDGYNTVVSGSTGGVPVFTLHGPSQVVMRDFVVGGSAGSAIDAITIDGADQLRGMVWADQLLAANSETNHVFADSLANVGLQLTNAHFLDSTGDAVNTTGSSNAISIYQCISVANASTSRFKIAGSANLFVEGCWNDSGTGLTATVGGSGSFTYTGSHVGVTHCSPTPCSVPVVSMSGFTGKALFGPADFTNDDWVSTSTLTIGTSSGANVLGDGVASDSTSFWSPSGNGAIQLLNPLKYTNTGTTTVSEACQNSGSSVGCPISASISGALAQMLNANPVAPQTSVTGITSVELHRLELSGARYGLHVEP